jgi:hypothetical protein
MTDTRPEPLFSAQLSSGAGTVFVDLKVAKNGKEYLSISELSTDKDGVKKRSSIRIFGDKVNSFKAAIADVPEVISRELTEEEAEALDRKKADFEADKKAAREVEDASRKPAKKY